MTTHKSGEVFVEYQTIDLSLLPSETRELQSHISEKLLLFSKNEEWNGEVMLVGENADFITNLRVFMLLRRRCTEIVYKENQNSSGRVIFSVYEKGQVLRPSAIQETLGLSPLEEKELKKNIEQREEGEAIELKGRISLESGFVMLNHLAVTKKQIIWNDVNLK